MSEVLPYSLDARLIRRRAARAAQSALEPDFLSREVARRMDARLDLVRLLPTRILDLGCGRGEDLAQLAVRYPEAQRIGLDFALPALRRIREGRSVLARLWKSGREARLVAADARALPLPAGAVHLVWSNLMLQCLDDPFPAFQEMHRVLAVGGLVMFATLGPDTLKELRAVAPDRVHRFIDMHDLGDALVKAGFSDPVMDMETLTLTYSSLDDLAGDLRRFGASNASASRQRGLGGRDAWRHIRAAYEPLRQSGRLPATVEIVYGHAWKAAPRMLADGRAVIQFAPSSKAP